MINPLHLSYSASHNDGGIAFAIADLMSSQQELGLYARWLSVDAYSPLNRASNLVQTVLNSEATLIHCHGLWRTQTRVAMQFINHKFPLVVSPHGMMDDWAMAHSSWKKELAWYFWEGNVLRSSSCLHALCEAEAISIQRRLPGKPVAVIPNGVNLPTEIIQPRDLVPWINDIPEDNKVVLFLGRFHQKKGLEPLMTAWQSVLEEAKKSGWWLVFVGFGDEGKFESQLMEFPVDNCRAYGPVFGDQKTACLHYSSGFILPSYSEGLPMAALEAMSHGLPCLLSSACNLPEAFLANAAIPAEPERSSIASALFKLFSMSDWHRTDMGANGRELAQTTFNWHRTAEMMADLYRCINQEKPMTSSMWMSK